MSNKLKLELMKDWLLDAARNIIPDWYQDYNIEDIDIEDESEVIDCFDTLHNIIHNKSDDEPYTSAYYDMWYYLGITTKKSMKDSDIEELKRLIGVNYARGCK